jgi:acyl-coenzyme A thioesterase PaaI-like protein
VEADLPIPGSSLNAETDDTTLPEAFFRVEGDAFRATAATRGPWSHEHQHGGPSAALLARAIEATCDAAAYRVGRFTVAFHRPVPIDVFRVAVETVREGRKVRVVRAGLLGADGKPFATAEGLLLRRADLGAEVPAAGDTRKDGMPRPDACAPFVFPFFSARVGYHVAMECRHMHGMFGEGVMGLWLRMRVPLVAGEPPSPLQRVACAADSGNGVSIALDLAKYTFLNPDLTVTLARELEGEWVGLDARTAFGDDGIGLSDTRLLDERGVVGRGLQTLLVERRSTG